MPADPLLVLAAAGLDAAVGYPDRLHQRVPHPVVWAGNAISALERAWNRPEASEGARRWLGVLTVLLVAGAAAALGWLPNLLPWPAMAACVVVLGSMGLAQRSLYDHVLAVLRPLEAGDLPTARAAVGMIVGRDVAALDASGVAAAALESLAESFNDGVAAPLFWFVVGGLPGLFAFKAVNTADSLIGHREPRWRAFGWAAARTDDLMNLMPARLAGGVVALAGGGGWRVMLADARKHASPNAGWPEAAMAGALGVRLGGATAYDGIVHPRPEFGAGPAPTAADLRRGLRVYVRACGLLWVALLAGAIAWPR
ncbi:MAG: cobalamin biosynthesis protein CobD [Phenylobacterium zucineum]|nr:MAG: cobalamin biosynthesis protein CobD [Phenylobacterium zucineum]